MRAIVFALCFLLAGAAGAMAAPRLANQTVMTYEPDHGTQVEYLAPDGRSFLWYPRNIRILPRHWKTEGSRICFRYDAHVYNRFTKSFWDEWKCVTMAQFRHKLSISGAGTCLG